MAADDLLTPAEAAELRRRSVKALETERYRGEGPAYVKDRGRVFYRRSVIEAYLAANTVEATR